MKRKRSAKEWVRFYGYWFWEYQRRNEAYRSDWLAFLSAVRENDLGNWYGTGDTSGLVIDVRVEEPVRYGVPVKLNPDRLLENELGLEVPAEVREDFNRFILNHGRPPKDPGVSDSAALFDSWIKGELEKICRDFDDIYSAPLLRLTPHVLAISKKIRTRNGVIFPAVEFLDLRLDPNACLELLMKEVRWAILRKQYVSWGLHRAWIPPARLRESRETGVEITEEEVWNALEELAQEVLEDEDFNYKGDGSSRVLGLWLYDKVRGREAKTVSEAIESLDRACGKQRVGYDQKSLRKFYNLTKRCIEE
ncbi:MAG: hypothetical protein EHM36_14805, partial [Deltaproteobacteria bacterium]